MHPEQARRVVFMDSTDYAYLNDKTEVDAADAQSGHIEESLLEMMDASFEFSGPDSFYAAFEAGFADLPITSDNTSFTQMQDHAEVMSTIGHHLKQQGSSGTHGWGAGADEGASVSFGDAPSKLTSSYGVEDALASGMKSQSGLHPQGWSLAVEKSSSAVAGDLARPENAHAIGEDAVLSKGGMGELAPVAYAYEVPQAESLVTSGNDTWAYTDDPLKALLYTENGFDSARWNISTGPVGTPVKLTYSFLTSVPSYANPSDFPGVTAFSAAQKTAVKNILSAVSEFANVTFTEVSGVGDLTFANHTFTDKQPENAVGYAFIPQLDPSTGKMTSLSGDIWLEAQAGWVSINPWSASPGGDGYQALIHEIGHALGLKHPFEKTYRLAADLDIDTYTQMSYTRNNAWAPVKVSDFSYQITPMHPSTFMTLDIVALQNLYGANTATRSGNDKYAWDTTPKRIETIWDGGGNDTIDCSKQVYSCNINLQEGAYSSIGLLLTDEDVRSAYNLPSGIFPFPSNLAAYKVFRGENSVAIARGVTIENAIGGSANDTLTGNAANNLLRGGGGNDLLYGGLGADTLEGATGNDTLKGDANNDSLYGGDGNDWLDGGAGADRMEGGNGNDVYVVDNASDKVIEAADAGIDTVRASITHILAVNAEKLELTGTANINGTGNTLANTLTGNNGNNTLDGAQGNDTLYGGLGDDFLNGGAGADYMDGGAGDDTYVVDDAGDKVVEAANAGTDTVRSSISYTLGNNVEQLVLLTGAGNINGIGNALANTLTGNNGHNTLDGGLGNDKLYGGLGDDFLNGGAGADYMKGGAGNDTYVVDNANDQIAEAANEGIDTVRASVSCTLGAEVEKLELTGTVNINGVGNILANTITGNEGVNILEGGVGNDTLYGKGGDDIGLYGNEGNDYLDGGVGADYMKGGTGDDVYIVDNTKDKAVEYAGGGVDTVRASVSYTLGAEVEKLELTGTASINGVGNALANTLTGNGGNNALNGGAGNDKLYGGSGNDLLNGGDGADLLFGQAGADKLYGGTGNDTFGYTLTTDSLLSAPDRIFDFDLEQDKVDFSKFDVNPSTSAMDHFTFTGSALFGANTPGQLRFEYNAATNLGTLYGNVDMNTTADFAIEFAGLKVLTAAGLIL